MWFCILTKHAAYPATVLVLCIHSSHNNGIWHRDKKDTALYVYSVCWEVWWLNRFLPLLLGAVDAATLSTILKFHFFNEHTSLDALFLFPFIPMHNILIINSWPNGNCPLIVRASIACTIAGFTSASRFQLQDRVPIFHYCFHLQDHYATTVSSHDLPLLWNLLIKSTNFLVHCLLFHNTSHLHSYEWIVT